jgi:hypothetical protein
MQGLASPEGRSWDVLKASLLERAHSHPSE